MIHLLLKSLAVLTAGLAAAGLAYYCLCLFGMFSFLRDCRRKRHASGFAPPVSILKPLRGTDPEMYESFRSYCLQDYGEYQIIFGVSDANDPAVALVEKLTSEFPERKIQLMVCPEILGTNVKVSNLLQMARVARYDHLLVSDSDIRVPADYLRRVLAPFSDTNVGMVTCLYRGVASHTLGSRLESIGTSTDFCPAVLAARQLQGIRFGLGSTLAFTRKALDAAGGFEPLLDYLADDYELGARIAQAGFRSTCVGSCSRSLSARLHHARVSRSPVALGARHSRLAPVGLCWIDRHVSAGVGRICCVVFGRGIVVLDFAGGHGSDESRSCVDRRKDDTAGSSVEARLLAHSIARCVRPGDLGR